MNSNISTKLRTFIAISAIAAVGATSTLAFAASSPTQQTVNAVEYANNSLLIQLSDGSNYVASTAQPSGCGPSATIDTLKIWASQAQSALLSGKPVKIYFSLCSSNNGNYISTMDLWVQ